MSKLGVVIVNWNTGPLLARCVASLLAPPDRDKISSIIVLDNASTDSSLAELKKILADHEAAPVVKIMPQTSNLGFARANNIGIAALRQESGSAHVLLLNPDTEIKPGALASLLGAAERHPRAGIIGPKLLNPDATLQPSVRRFPTLPIFVLWFLKIARLAAGTRVWQRYVWADFNYEREQVVDQVMGAAFFIRGETLAAIGPLDEQYWMSFEEVDYCWRARAAGWEVRYTPAATVMHHGAVSFNQLTGWARVGPFTRSARQYARKHLGAAAGTLLWLLTPLTYALSLPAGIFHRYARA